MDNAFWTRKFGIKLWIVILCCFDANNIGILCVSKGMPATSGLS